MEYLQHSTLSPLMQGSSTLLLEVNYPLEFHSYCNQTSESPYQALRDSFPDGVLGQFRTKEQD